MVSLLTRFTLALAVVVSAQAARLPHRGRSHGNMRPSAVVPIVELKNTGTRVDKNGAALPPLNTTYEFDQLIDHNNPGLGTFKQRFWTTWEFYEPGGPIVLFTPGEANAAPYTGYLTNETINGQIAQQENGATIVLEHRFFGESNPFDDLSVQSLQVLNIQQAIDDLVFFADNVELPMPGGDDVAPGKAPWVLVGGSYSGALTAWTVQNKPGVFQAAYASSAVVETIVDFWQYFDPIRRNMAQNCSSDVQVVIAHVDSVFTSGNQKEIDALKANWNLGNITHLDDVAGALRNNLWDWQSLSPTSGGGFFFDFCDALEVKDGVSAGPQGWGLEHALEAWGSYWNTTYYALVCGDSDAVSCLGTYDPTQTFWTDITVDNAERSWEWFVCNQVGFFQEGAPSNTPTLVTRLVKPEYDERQCTYFFSEQFSKPTTPNTAAVNAAYDGWNINVDRLFFANGQRDPWRDATVSSDYHMRQSTSSQPIAIGDGYHCSDLSSAAGVIDKTINAVQTEALAKMKTWLAEWKPSKKLVRREESEEEPRQRKAIGIAFRDAPVIQ